MDAIRGNGCDVNMRGYAAVFWYDNMQSGKYVSLNVDTRLYGVTSQKTNFNIHCHENVEVFPIYLTVKTQQPQ